MSLQSVCAGEDEEDDGQGRERSAHDGFHRATAVLRSGDAPDIAFELVLDLVEPAAYRHLGGPAGVQGVERAGQEAGSAKRRELAAA